jgi:hypothetical protein
VVVLLVEDGLEATVVIEAIVNPVRNESDERSVLNNASFLPT